MIRGDYMRSCTFIGHRDCSSEIVLKLYNVIEALILKEQIKCFYVGNHGGFDKCVYTVLCDLKKK